MTGSQRRALMLVGLSRSSWHYRNRPRARVSAPVAHTDRAYPTRISDDDRAVIEGYVRAAWEQGCSVDYAFADAWDRGVMLASRRSWWRIARAMSDQHARPVIATGRAFSRSREKPVVVATGPGQVWSWDITDLKTPFSRKAFKAYCIIDIYSRQIVGYRCEEREVDDLAVKMFERAIATHGAPKIVHADSGAAMRSNALAQALDAHGVTMSHNRPYTSNDNPYSESEFRTMKYRPNYPGRFKTLEEARTFLAEYVPWYNTSHKHSGIALFPPAAVHDGTWKQLWEQRVTRLEEYFSKHPERFTHPPVVPTPATVVGINHQPTT